MSFEVVGVCVCGVNLCGVFQLIFNSVIDLIIIFLISMAVINGRVTGGFCGRGYAAQALSCFPVGEKNRINRELEKPLCRCTTFYVTFPLC